MEVGNQVNVVDKFSGTKRIVCKAKIKRITPTLYITINEYGNEGRYRRKDSKMVGYAWPQLTNEIELVTV